MRFPWVDTLLLLLIVVGAYYVWQSGSERARLQAEHVRLKQLTGELIPVDPTKVYVRAIETGDPLDFAWRVYLPAKYQLNVRHSRGSSSSGHNSQPVHAIVRTRFKEVDGGWRVYHRFPFSSGLSSVDPHFTDVLKKRPEQLKVEQFGRGRTEEVDPSREFLLLRVKLPDEKTKGKEAGSSDMRSHPPEPLMELVVGPSGRT